MTIKIVILLIESLKSNHDLLVLVEILKKNLKYINCKSSSNGIIVTNKKKGDCYYDCKISSICKSNATLKRNKN